MYFIKPFNALTLTELSNLLYHWFPDELPLFITKMMENYESIQKSKESIRKGWHHEILSFEQWFEIVDETYMVLIENEEKGISREVFTGKLFNGLFAIWTLQCLIDYVSYHTNNQSFIKAVLLFFIKEDVSTNTLATKMLILHMEILEVMRLNADVLLEDNQEVNLPVDNPNLSIPTDFELSPGNPIEYIMIHKEEILIKFKNGKDNTDISKTTLLSLNDLYVITTIIRAYIEARNKLSKLK